MTERVSHWLPRARLWAVLCVAVSLAPALASAQPGSPIDAQGNLTRMPFDPDLPVVSETVRVEGGSTWFVVYLRTSYDDVVEHYQHAYQWHTELAPDWLLQGYGLDRGAEAMMFTLGYRDSLRFIMHVHEDPESGYTVLKVKADSSGDPTLPYLNSVAPFRASDMEPVVYDDL